MVNNHKWGVVYKPAVEEADCMLADLRDAGEIWNWYRGCAILVYFALAGLKDWVPVYPGRCPGLLYCGLSGLVNSDYS